MPTDTVQPMAVHDMVHAGWGDPSRRKGLPSEAVAWLAARVGQGASSVPVPLGDVRRTGVAVGRC